MPFGVSYEDGVAVIRVDGTFDGEAAARIRTMLIADAGSQMTRAVIDFARARDVSDIALAALVGTMSERSTVQVSVRGLTTRHSRMMRLLSPQTGPQLEDSSGAPGA